MSRSRTDSKKGNCAFCKSDRNLKNSHSIPLAAFRPLLKSGSGSLIAIPNGNDNVRRIQDTGAYEMLCFQCEREFNEEFDSQLIYVLKSLREKCSATEGFAVVKANTDIFAKSMVSVVWRMAYSGAQMYSDIKLTHLQLQMINDLMSKEADQTLRFCSISIAHLIDKRTPEAGGFTREHFSQFILNPRLYRAKRKSGFMIEWTMFGFLIHLIVPRLTNSNLKKFHGLKRHDEVVRSVPQYFLDNPSLEAALLSGLQANEEGRVSPSIKQRR